jgi:hypothetical protein
MVVLVDLDDDTPLELVPRAPQKPLHHSLGAEDPVPNKSDNNDSEATVDGPNPNINGFSAALCCYP